MEGSEAPNLSAARDSDSDEGIAAAGDNEKAFNPHEAPTPTAEEGEYANESVYHAPLRPNLFILFLYIWYLALA